MTKQTKKMGKKPSKSIKSSRGKKSKDSKKSKTHKNIRSKPSKASKSKKTQKVYSKKEYSSGDGMLTTVWGPSLWHVLHTMSFNYPVTPTKEDKKHYLDFVKLLPHVLPCKYCRINLKNNFKTLPPTMEVMKSRDSFSRYIYNLHELVNKMLKKKSNLAYCDVRNRYEHFRARCNTEKPDIWKMKNIKKSAKEQITGEKKSTKEKGCTEPLYSGEKSKCILKIVPQSTNESTFQMDKKCVKKKIK